MATTKDGMEIVPTDMTPVNLSTKLLRRIAEKQPSGMPSRMAQPRPVAIRISVYGKFSMRMMETLRSVSGSVPKSPRAPLPRNRATCMGSGWFRPISSLSRATRSGVARGPSMIVARSPGITRVAPNSMIVAATQMTKPKPTRWAA